MKSKNLLKTLPAILALTPIISFAQVVPGGQSAQGLLGIAVGFLNRALPILVTVAIVIFVFNVVRYVIADSDEAKEKGKKSMLWGLIGIFVILALWGIIAVISNTIGVGIGGDLSGFTPGIPTN